MSCKKKKNQKTDIYIFTNIQQTNKKITQEKKKKTQVMKLMSLKMAELTDCFLKLKIQLHLH